MTLQTQAHTVILLVGQGFQCLPLGLVSRRHFYRDSLYRHSKFRPFRATVGTAVVAAADFAFSGNSFVLDQCIAPVVRFLLTAFDEDVGNGVVKIRFNIMLSPAHRF